jgi:oligoendopeptidase F
MLALRAQVAQNAGFSNFRDYQFRAYERFDYTPQDCFDFHSAVERHVVPVVREMLEQRRAAMEIESVRPWDTACDPHGRPALRPFESTDQLAEGCLEVFAKLDGELANKFEQMIALGLLDLESRKGKAPGGYQQDLGENRLPFIFMNAVGLNKDLFTLLHEGGHAFHHFATQPEPLLSYRHSPTEFSEVASMTMELLNMPYLDVFYSPQDHVRTMRSEWEAKLSFFPWCATIDAFQHWLYTNPGHSRKDRCDYWVELTKRFGAGVDHSGYEDALRYRWQAQLHIFEVPFYYIEYGIAQLGAMQIWSNSLRDERAAVGAYKNALKLGGSRPLPDLFHAANTQFDFSEDTLQPLMKEVSTELDRLRELEALAAPEAAN